MAKINFDYLNIFKEPVLFCAALVRQALKQKPKTADSNGAILVVNTCLVGEFAASLPALHEFIKRNTDKSVDLLVSPPLRPLAQHLRGARAVYTARSVFARAAEHHHAHSPVSGAYEKTVVMRISPDAYRALGTIETAALKTSLWPMTSYGIHMGWHLLTAKTPKSWREVNFDMFGLAPKNFSFEEIFDFNDEDYKRIEQKFPLLALPKKIIIHTGASWVTNRWRAGNWVETLKKLRPQGYDFIFAGAGTEDKADYDFISSRLDFKTHSLIGQTDVVELVLLLYQSQYFIGVDSGPRNFAHLVNLPSVTLLGPGPHMYTPENPRDIILDRSQGRGLYQRFFHKKSGLFIDRITPQDVADAFARLRAQTSG